MKFFLQGSSSLVHHTSYSLIPAPKRRRLECNIQLELDSTYYVEVQQRQCMDECTSSSVSSVMAEAEETATKTPKFSNKFIIEWNKCICTKQGPKSNSRGKQAYLSWLVFIIELNQRKHKFKIKTSWPSFQTWILTL